MAAEDSAGNAGRHPGNTGLQGEVIKVGRVSLHLGRLEADAGQGPVPLTRLEFLLLKELAVHPGQPVPKGMLLAEVWGYDFDPGSNVVDVCVRRLRSKFGFGLIKTVRGAGYQLAGQLPASRPSRSGAKNTISLWRHLYQDVRKSAVPRRASQRLMGWCCAIALLMQDGQMLQAPAARIAAELNKSPALPL